MWLPKSVSTPVSKARILAFSGSTGAVIWLGALLPPSDVELHSARVSKAL
jgi:hypothetical protein